MASEPSKEGAKTDDRVRAVICWGLVVVRQRVCGVLCRVVGRDLDSYTVSSSRSSLRGPIGHSLCIPACAGRT